MDGITDSMDMSLGKLRDLVTDREAWLQSPSAVILEPKKMKSVTYNYTVEVINSIRSDRVPEELWMAVHSIVQEAVTKTIPKRKKCKKAKWLSETAL